MLVDDVERCPLVTVLDAFVAQVRNFATSHWQDEFSWYRVRRHVQDDMSETRSFLFAITIASTSRREKIVHVVNFSFTCRKNFRVDESDAAGRSRSVQGITVERLASLPAPTATEGAIRHPCKRERLRRRN